MATNRNGGMLRLIASRHDDDDDETAYRPLALSLFSLYCTNFVIFFHLSFGPLLRANPGEPLLPETIRQAQMQPHFKKLLKTFTFKEFL